MGQNKSRDHGMTTFTPRIVELTEYQTRTFDEDELTEAEGKELHASYGNQISVEPPSFLNNQSWQLTSQGWVGYIPLTDSFHLSLVPKVPVANLFAFVPKIEIELTIRPKDEGVDAVMA